MKRFFGITLVFLAACGPGPSINMPGGINYDAICPCTPRRGIPSGLAYRPDLMWPNPIVHVCFDNGRAEQRMWAEDAIDRTWNLASRLTFVGWGDCDGAARPTQDVRLAFSDHFEIQGLGVQLNHYTHGVVLGTPNGTEHDLRRQAVYAFGFVAGFTAEQDRGDTPASCTTLNRFPADSQTTLGPWDDRSAMNDCNPVEQYNGGLLSEGDIAGIQRVYGEPTSCTCG